MSAISIDYLADTPEGETLENLKVEYLRVYGRLPRINRSGLWIIVDYTPMRATELLEMLKSLSASPSLNGGERTNS